MSITEVDVQKLAYKTMLRQIQHIPKNTATPAVYLLIGAIPIESQLDIHILTFFNRILLQQQSLEYDLVRRQLAMKDLQSHSWVITVRNILAKYNLPSAYTLLQQNRRRSQWKRQVKAAVVYYWNRKLKEAAQPKKTMK